MANPGNIFDGRADKATTTKATANVLMDKADPVGIFYSKTCCSVQVKPDYPTFSPINYPTFPPVDYPTFSPADYPTFSPANFPTGSPTTADAEGDTCGQLMYADYIAYYFDGNGRVTIGVTGTIGETAFF
jgi:hypothetical protein